MPDKTRFALALAGRVGIRPAAIAAIRAARGRRPHRAGAARCCCRCCGTAPRASSWSRCCCSLPLALIVRALFRRYVEAPRAARRGREDHADRQSRAPGAARAAPPRSGGSPRASTRFADAQRALQQRRRAARARGERAHRAGKKPPRGADVGARAKRDHVQRRGAHPAVQRARDAAPAQAARQRRARPARRTASSGSGVRSSRSSTAT